jgi:ribosomal protein S18 acetylase RimI-like enzyme
MAINYIGRGRHTVTTTTWLEMHSPADLRAPAPRAGVVVQRIDPPDPALNARLYASVGADYRWVDRLGWSGDDWQRYVTRPDLETWLLVDGETPAGYFELLQHPGGTDEPARSVEIAYFGLLPDFVGRGLGAMLLAAAIRRGWELPVARVWLHTSSHDHPHALANYLARGFRIYRVEVS